MDLSLVVCRSIGLVEQTMVRQGAMSRRFACVMGWMGPLVWMVGRLELPWLDRMQLMIALERELKFGVMDLVSGDLRRQGRLGGLSVRAVGSSLNGLCNMFSRWLPNSWLALVIRRSGVLWTFVNVTGRYCWSGVGD